MKPLHEQLQAARINARFTQEKLSEKIGVTRQTISSWECQNSQPDMGSVVKIASILNCEFYLDGDMVIGPRRKEELSEAPQDQQPHDESSTIAQPGRKKKLFPLIISFIAGILAKLTKRPVDALTQKQAQIFFQALGGCNPLFYAIAFSGDTRRFTAASQVKNCVSWGI